MKRALLVVVVCASTAMPALADAQERARLPRPSIESEARPSGRLPRAERDDDMRPRVLPPRPPVDDDARPPARFTRPLPEIVAQVQATPPYSEMDYIGVAGFHTRPMIYVLRFLDGRQVVVVHVDARSGRVLRRAP